MSRFEEINLPEYRREVQLPLFGISERVENSLNCWPNYSIGEQAIDDFIGEFNEPYMGIDLEFNTDTKRCSILGLSSRSKCVSAPFNLSQAKEVISGAKKGKYKLVGFSIFGAEKEILEHNLGEELSLDLFEDTMLLFHLCNSHLTKSTGGKEGSEKGTLGFINLYTCSSIYCKHPNHKLCREEFCDGPCPKHDVFGYNAVDAFDGLEAWYLLLDEAKKYGLTYQFYRDIYTCSYVAHLMKVNGVNVDRVLARDLDKITTEEKELLFEKNPDYDVIPFNPDSNQEALQYFKEEKIPLKDYTKPELMATIKKLASKKGMDVDEFINCPDNSEPVKWLIRAAQYKGLGKGFKGWFADKYFGIDGYLHPRFITTGTQTGRWASSGPNLQNMPGFKED